MNMQLLENEYLSLATTFEGEYKEKGSRFIAYASPVSDEKDTDRFLEEIKKQHHKARHHCYAYRIGHGDNTVERANDDGEPSGTAGRPILGQLHSFNIEQSMIVVVRYFGGVKLGASGLIRAYKNAARDVLNSAKIVKQQILSHWRITTDYTCSHHFMDACKKLDVNILEQDFGATAAFIIGLPPQLEKRMLLELKSYTLQIPLEMARDEKSDSWKVEYSGENNQV